MLLERTDLKRQNPALAAASEEHLLALQKAFHTLQVATYLEIVLSFPKELQEVALQAEFGCGFSALELFHAIEKRYIAGTLEMDEFKDLPCLRAELAKAPRQFTHSEWAIYIDGLANCMQEHELSMIAKEETQQRDLEAKEALIAELTRKLTAMTKLFTEEPRPAKSKPKKAPTKQHQNSNEDKYQAMVERLRQQEAALEAKSAQIKNLERENEALGQKHIEALAIERSRDTNTIAELQDKVRELVKNNYQLRREKKEDKATIDNLEKLSQEISKDKDKLKAEYEQKIADLKLVAAEQGQKLAAQRKDFEAEKLKLEARQQQARLSSEKEIQSLRTAVEDSRKKMLRQSQSHHKLEQSIADLEAICQEKQQMLYSSKLDSDRLADFIAQLKQEIGGLRYNFSSVSQRYNQLRTAHANKIAELQQAIQDLKKELAQARAVQGEKPGFISHPPQFFNGTVTIIGPSPAGAISVPVSPTEGLHGRSALFENSIWSPTAAANPQGSWEALLSRSQSGSPPKI